MSKEIELKLTVEEANQVLEGLGQLPFASVYALVGKIQEQARSQLGSPVPESSNVEPFAKAEDEEKADAA